jgi:enoyl-CoA hydratase/carnithine racemase
VPIEQVVTVSLPPSGVDAIWDELTAAGRTLPGTTRVVVLRTAGAAFVDEAVADGSPDDGSADEPPSAAIEWLTRPDVVTIAAVTGRVAGALLDAALACDLRIVADDAQLSPSRSVSGVARLGELMGYSRALEFVVTGAAISGRLAVTVGLANLSVGSQMLDEAVAETVAAVLRTPREVATVAKAVLSEAAADRRRLADELAAGVALAANEG